MVHLWAFLHGNVSFCVFKLVCYILVTRRHLESLMSNLAWHTMHKITILELQHREKLTVNIDSLHKANHMASEGLECTVCHISCTDYILGFLSVFLQAFKWDRTLYRAAFSSFVFLTKRNKINQLHILAFIYVRPKGLKRISPFLSFFFDKNKKLIKNVK